MKLISKIASYCWKHIQHPIRNLERDLFKAIPHNCFVKVCPNAAKKGDKNWHYFCPVHEERGVWK